MSIPGHRSILQESYRLSIQMQCTIQALVFLWKKNVTLDSALRNQASILSRLILYLKLSDLSECLDSSDSLLISTDVKFFIPYHLFPPPPMPPDNSKVRYICLAMDLFFCRQLETYFICACNWRFPILLHKK